MAKISELSDGGSLQSTDFLIAVRSGGNVKVQADGNLSLGTVTASDGVFTGGAAGSSSVFNEDGTTADFRVESTSNTHMLFVDGGLNRVGIGTASPAFDLDISSSNPNQLQTTSSTTVSNFYQTTSSGTTVIQNTSGQMAIYTGGGERMRIDAQGQVRLSNTTPVWDTAFSSLVTKGGFVGSQSTSYLYSGQNIYYNGGFKFSTAADATLYEQSFGKHIWYRSTDASPAAGAAITLEAAMTLDDSGNLLVGRTATSNANTDNGVELGGVGYIYSIRNATSTGNGEPQLILNRNDYDGAIVNIQKDGTTVGSIGTSGGTIYAGNGGSGLIFNNGGTKDLIPYSLTAADTVDDSISLGISSKRFKDLYLSGGVVFPDAGATGTATSNTLDSYEEGTFTATIEGATSNPTVTYDAARSATYTKIGDTVFARVRMRTDAVSGGAGLLKIAGLPFTSTTKFGTVNVGFASDWGSDAPAAGYVNPSSTFAYLTFRTTANGNTNNYIEIADLATGGNSNDVIMTLIYPAS